MGYQIIKQPNGNLCLFSSISDKFVLLDATDDDVVAFFIELETQDLRRRVSETLKKVHAGEKAYHQYTMTWEEALADHRRNADNSDDEFNKAVEALADLPEKR